MILMPPPLTFPFLSGFLDPSGRCVIHRVKPGSHTFKQAALSLLEKFATDLRRCCLFAVAGGGFEWLAHKCLQVNTINFWLKSLADGIEAFLECFISILKCYR